MTFRNLYLKYLLYCNRNDVMFRMNHYYKYVLDLNNIAITRTQKSHYIEHYILLSFDNENTSYNAKPPQPGAWDNSVQNSFRLVYILLHIREAIGKYVFDMRLVIEVWFAPDNRVSDTVLCLQGSEVYSLLL